jgi:hypothetical protein
VWVWVCVFVSVQYYTGIFIFGGLCILLRVLSRFLEEPYLATTLKGVYFIYILLPLHVSAPVGHLQPEYRTILGSYFTYNGSVVLCY